MRGILLLETTGRMCSVAFAQSGEVVAERSDHRPRAHAEVLSQLIEKVLSDAGQSRTQLDAVAVSQGPGSYTGLRIGVSTAKGICFARDIPLIGISTLRALTNGMQTLRAEAGMPDFFLPMIDARRMEVYMAVYDQNGTTILPEQPTVLRKDTMKYWLRKGQVLCFGDKIQKVKALFNNPERLEVVDNFPPQSRFLAAPAYHKWHEKQFEDLAYFEPAYLKNFIGTKNKK